jgi:hypothetical protein
MFGHNDDNNKPATDYNEHDESSTDQEILEAEHRKPEKIIEPPADSPAAHDEPVDHGPKFKVGSISNGAASSLKSSLPASDSNAADNLLESNELLDIKNKALKQLSPLVEHIDGSPEDKFRTLMMVIQSSDDQSLLKKAYEAAESIQDEKTRAQALLDIVNEINYFTSHNSQD